jgi:hypothetical protein
VLADRLRTDVRRFVCVVETDIQIGDRKKHCSTVHSEFAALIMTAASPQHCPLLSSGVRFLRVPNGPRTLPALAAVIYTLSVTF